MTPDYEERLQHLCNRVQQELDPAKFDLYVRELNELLERKERRVRKEWLQDPLVEKPIPSR